MTYTRRPERGSRPSGLVLLLAALGAFLLGLGRLPAPRTTPAVTPSAAAAIEAAPDAATEPTRTVAPAVAPVAVAATGDAPVAVSETASPRLLDIGDLRRPRIRAAAAMLYNPGSGEVLWERRGLEPRPIASITKVMTALVLLDQGPDPARDVVVSRRDVRRASTTYLRRGERVTIEELLHLALIASDNVAARILARASGWGTRRFVERMNLKAAALGLDGTRFVEPSGLDERNVSTPYDVARLMAAASEVPAISRIMRKATHRVRTDRRRVNIRNTNRLLRSRHTVQGGKTGYINEAGFCFTAMVEVPDADPIVLVVLGAGSNAGRFDEARRLIEWVSTTGRSLLEPGRRAN